MGVLSMIYNLNDFDIEGEIIDIPTPKYMTDRVSTKGRVIKGTANTKYKNNFYFG